jgi:SulP family sulfate permease
MAEPLTPDSLPDIDANGDSDAVLERAALGRWYWLFHFVPALESLRTYSFASFRLDLLAGLTVAAVAVPQAMAYALIVGIEPKYGLYTAIVMTCVGALLDSSKQLINGPTNAISIAMLSALAVFAPADRASGAIMLALLVGLIQTGITLLRLGDLTRYISHSVIVGFTAGASLLLVLDQLKNLLGVPVPPGGSHDHFLWRFWLTLENLGRLNPWAAALGLGSIALSLGLRWLKHRWRIELLPEYFVTVIAMALLVWYFDLEHRHQVGVVGAIPASIFSFQLPTIHWEHFRALSQSALAIGLLGLLEAIAMAKAIAARTGQKLDMNQQCLSEGLANLTGSFFQCMPGSGSLTRSAINQAAGAVSQWSGVFSALAVAATVLLFAPFAYYIPRAALAGILTLTSWRMVDRQQLLYHWRATRFDKAIVLATAVSAIAISIEFCIMIGIFLSFMLYVRRAARLHMAELLVTPERIIRERVSADPRCGRILIFNLEGELFFGAAPDLEKHLEQIERQCRDGIRVVVLRMKRARNPDAVCIHLLDEFLQRMDTNKIAVLLCGVQADLYRALRKTGISQRLDPTRIFLEEPGVFSSTLKAVRHAYDLLGGDVCSVCPRKAEENKEPLYYMI